MAQLTEAGGSRAWRRTVAAVLARDRYVCRMRRDGHRCGAVATTANHVIPRRLGGTDAMSNLEAACAPCNMADGGRLAATLAARAALVEVHNTVTAIVAILDRYGAPADAGRRVALDVLARRTPHRWRTRDVDHACAYRRARGPLTRW